MARWTNKHAKDWWQGRPWVCGFNFLPSTAVNFIEMWHPDTFDMPTITQELSWAANIGFNAIRINLPYLGWVHDGDGLMDRLGQVMDVAHGLGIDTIPCLFDDCGFGGDEPVWGPQAAPVPGVHNSRAVASPGRAIVMDPMKRESLQAYVQTVVGKFRNDSRILFWDLYNEPGNRMTFAEGDFEHYAFALEQSALSLMESCFEWARSQSPIQPLTVAAWTTPLPGDDSKPYQTKIDQSALLNSDIVTFHAYWNCARVSEFIDVLSVLDRPILCTEWMARAVDSQISDQLELFHDRRIGCFQWGLVKGRTQTWMPWPDELVKAHGGDPSRNIWFHDLLHEDGRPYDEQEIETIKRLTSNAARVTEGIAI